MKVELPESVKSDVPPNAWGKILGMTPVVMAVVATMLAGRWTHNPPPWD